MITVIAARMHMTPAHIALSWAVQRGSAFLTTSTKSQRFNAVVESGVPGFIPRAR